MPLTATDNHDGREGKGVVSAGMDTNSLSGRGEGAGAMRLGVSSWCFRHENILEALGRISSCGARYVELFANNFHLDPRRGATDPTALISSLKRRGLQALSLHLPFANIEGKEGGHGVRAAWLDLVEACFRVVEALHIPKVVVHPQITAPDEHGRRMALDVVEAVESHLIPRAAREGTAVLLENLHPIAFTSYFGCREIGAILERWNTKNTGLCLDVSHCFCSGLDPVEEIGLCGKWIREIHLSDNRYEPKSDRHLAPGAGSLDWESFLEAVQNTCTRADLILEVDGGQTPRAGVEASLAFIRSRLGGRIEG